MKTLLEKLSQESTWRGLIAIAAGFGVQISPEFTNQIIPAALGLIGFINVIKKD